MKAVHGCNDVAERGLPVFVGQEVVALAGGGDDVARVVEVDFFVVGKAVDDEVGGQFGIRRTLLGSPVEHITVGRPFGTEFLDTLRGAVVLVRIGRDESRIAVIATAEAVGYAPIVPEDFVGRPEAVAADVGQCPLVVHLAGEVAGAHGPGDVLSDVEVRFPGVAVPPFNQGDIVRRRVSDFPIYLRHIVVNPTLLEPMRDVGVEVVVVLQALRLAARSVGRTPFVPIDTEGADAEAHPRFRQEDSPAQFAHELVHIVAPPVGSLRSLEAFCQAILAETLVVGEVHARHGIRIEVVVHVNSIHIVARNDVPYHAADELAARRYARVEEYLFVVADEPFGMFMVDVRIRKRRIASRAGAIGIEPGVELHVAAMALGDEEGHQVEIPFGGEALLAGVEAAPRFQFRGIEGIGFGAYLEDDGVDAAPLEIVQFADEAPFHLRDGHLGVFALEGSLYPCAPELALSALVGRGGLLAGLCRRASRDKQ